MSKLADFADAASRAGVIVVLRLWNKGFDGGRNDTAFKLLKDNIQGEWTPNTRGIRIRDKLHLEWGERFDWPDISLDEIASSGENNAKIGTNNEHSGDKSPQNSINCATSGSDRLESHADLGTSGGNRADLAASGENSTQNTTKSAPCGEHNAKNGANFDSSGVNLAKSDAYHGFCYGMLDHVGVLADGTVVPCCLDADGEIALGNIFESDLSEILASPRARAIADGFKHHQKVEPLCRRCGYSKRFD